MLKGSGTVKVLDLFLVHIKISEVREANPERVKYYSTGCQH